MGVLQNIEAKGGELKAQHIEKARNALAYAGDAADGRRGGNGRGGDGEEEEEILGARWDEVEVRRCVISHSIHLRFFLSLFLSLHSSFLFPYFVPAPAVRESPALSPHAMWLPLRILADRAIVVAGAALL
ncbi:hypothetical protein B0H11DRAFT_1910530 [Mycena galericulata]|nr:hypothetical protein B0H11DRAFT_1910530 [Mycena galericulata]